MDLLIKYTCQLCASTKYWVYREEEGLLPRGFRGCPGGCQLCHDLSVTEIDDESQEKYAQEILEEYPTVGG